MLFGAMNNPTKPILEEIRTIARLGFDYLELTMDPPQTHHSQVGANGMQIKDTLAGFQMGLVCHMPTFVYTADLTETIRQSSLTEILSSLDVAAALNPAKIVLHPSYIGGLGAFEIQKAKQMAMESLATIVAHADQLGLCLCIENMFPRYNGFVEPEDFLDIFQQFPQLRFTLDAGHANIGDQGKNRFQGFIELFSEQLFHLHVSDNFGKEDNHLPVGSASINFKNIIKLLKKHDYNSTVTHEVFTKDRDYLKISRRKFTAIWEQV
ncbi:MAG: sugar phosphate isomerase/epimerase [Desulfobacterales bacterium]|nr:sugar phosphate isomerase/epimerase [Desulfobacterales bacterium]